MHKVIEECQICFNALESVIYLGHVAPVNALRAGGGPRAPAGSGEELRFPLEMMRCTECGHVQLGFQVDPKVLFPPSYPYRSGTTQALKDNFKELAEEIKAHLESCGNGDLLNIFDIGCNDGTLLGNFFCGPRFRPFGIEPSEAGETARQKGIWVLGGFFTYAAAQALLAVHSPMEVMTACNVFAHMADVHDVMNGVECMLADDGVFVSENHYLLALLEGTQYDTIYHEHLRYYHLGALKKLFAMHGMEVFRVKRIDSHGGSIRVWACRKGKRPIEESVGLMLEDEEAAGLRDGSWVEAFVQSVRQSKWDLLSWLAEAKGLGQSIWGVGAPSRASTLISYCGLDEGIIEGVAEVSSSPKVGLWMPGTRIPVKDEAEFLEEQPAVALFFSWHIAQELGPKLRAKGFRGRMMVPLPQVRWLEEF